VRWTDVGIVVLRQPCGEHGFLLKLLTREHGLYAGFLKNSQRKSNTNLYQPGDCVYASWSARLEDHLGYFTLDSKKYFSYIAFVNRKALAVINAFCALIVAYAAERYAYPAIYTHGYNLLESLGNDDQSIWTRLYVLWEMLLLSELGFGLDLGSCVVNGSSDDLIYVSPKSGKAVSRDAGEPYRDRLLTLPKVFLDSRSWVENEMLAPALKLTGFFLENRVANALTERVPLSRSIMLRELGIL